MVAGIIINRKVKRIMKKIILSMLLMSGCIVAMDEKKVVEEKDDIKDIFFVEESGCPKHLDLFLRLVKDFQKPTFEQFWTLKVAADALNFLALGDIAFREMSVHKDNVGTGCFKSDQESKGECPNLGHVVLKKSCKLKSVQNYFGPMIKSFSFVEKVFFSKAELLCWWLKHKTKMTLKRRNPENHRGLEDYARLVMSIEDDMPKEKWNEKLFMALSNNFCHQLKKNRQLSQENDELKKFLTNKSNKNEQ